MKKLFLTVSILLILFAGCQLDSAGQYSYEQPEYIDDGLDIGSLDEVNINARWIERAVNEVQGGRYREVHSILIYRDEKLVFEKYFQGHAYQWDGPNHHGELVTWNRDMLHMIASDTKSITSTCIGIAIDKGYIESLHQSIFDYLPDYRHLKKNGKEEITIEHLVTMTSGLKWDEWGAPLSSAANDIIGLWFNCEDQIACILERPLVSEPGTSFTYNGGGMIVLGEIIRNATQMDIEEFSKKYLFEPLGIDSANWSVRYPNGVIEAAGSLELKPRDMLKVGITFLNNGSWKGQQIVSGEWVEKSAGAYNNNKGINVPGTDGKGLGYSYSWWTYEFYKSGKRISGYYAGGWGGQKILVIPDLNAVVILTGGTYTSKTRTFKVLETYIIPAFDG